MAQDMSNLDRRVARWLARVVVTRWAELAAVMILGACGGAILLLGAAAWLGGLSVAARAPLALAGVVVAVASIRLVRGGAAVRATAWSLAVGWSAALLAGPMIPGSGGSVQADRLVIALALLAGVALAATLISLRGARRRIAAWLDAQVGSHLLLATGWELARGDGLTGPLAQVVLQRADRFAAGRLRFRNVSARRLGGRWWGLLPVAIAAVVLAAWIAQQFESTPQAASARSVAPAQPGGSSSARTLHGLVVAARSMGQADLADQFAATAERVDAAAFDEPAQADLVRRRDQFEQQLAQARDVLEALGNLDPRAAGDAIAAVLVDPDQSPEQRANLARQQGQAWRALSTADRVALAEQLRQAADRLAASNPALADRLARLADALGSGRDADALTELESILAAVQPIAGRRQLTERAVAAIDAALATTGPGGSARPSPTVPLASTKPLPSAGQLWQDLQRLEANMLLEQEIQSLPPRQQELVRRYFSLPK